MRGTALRSSIVAIIVLAYEVLSVSSFAITKHLIAHFALDRRTLINGMANIFVGLNMLDGAEMKDNAVPSLLLDFTPVIPKMIVFDKDGTLLDQAPSLKHWVREMSSNLIRELVNNGYQDPQIEADVEVFHKAIGWDSHSQKLVPSAPLAAGTWAEQIETCSTLFHAMGVADARAKALKWHQGMGNLHSKDEPLVDDLQGLLKECKLRNLIVAIATSDDRISTEIALTNHGLKDLVDVSLLYMLSLILMIVSLFCSNDSVSILL